MIQYNCHHVHEVTDTVVSSVYYVAVLHLSYCIIYASLSYCEIKNTVLGVTIYIYICYTQFANSAFGQKKQPQRILEKRKQPRNEISRRGSYVTATTRSGKCRNATKRTLRRGRRKKQPQRVENSKNSQIAMWSFPLTATTRCG